MNIAIDTTPLEETRTLSHKVRGTGFYISNLKRSLEKYYPNNSYNYFIRGEKISDAVDIVHYPYFEPFFLTLPLNKKHKTVVTVHDLTPLIFPEHFPSGIRGNAKWILQRLALKDVDAVITDSNASKNDIMRIAGIKEEKIYVVYLTAGEEFKRIKNQPIRQAQGKESRIKNLKSKYNLPEKFALYVGDATWNKNLPSLVEAAVIAEVPLVMVGKTLEEKEFDKKNPWNKDLVLVQKSIVASSTVQTLGFVPTEELVALYNLASVFVMPSLYEGFGLPILEAMSCGCPVITSKGGSLPEVAGDGAYYVDAYDRDSIAAGIKKVFNDSQLQKELREKGIQHAANFSWKKTAQETIKVYEAIVK